MRRLPEKTQFVLLGSLLSIGVSRDCWASGGSGGLSMEVFWQTVSFVLLVTLLTVLLKKPLRAFLGKRRDDIKTSLEQAAKKEGEAGNLFADWEKKIQVMEQEIAELKAKISLEGEIERKRILDRAQEEGDRIRKQAQVVADQEFSKARADLKKEMIDLSVEFAERVLQEMTQPADQERLVKEYIGKVRELR
jgi:F-type H+-transporting ATPase subunit b